MQSNSRASKGSRRTRISVVNVQESDEGEVPGSVTQRNSYIQRRKPIDDYKYLLANDMRSPKSDRISMVARSSSMTNFREFSLSQIPSKYQKFVNHDFNMSFDNVSGGLARFFHHKLFSYRKSGFVGEQHINRSCQGELFGKQSKKIRKFSKLKKEIYHFVHVKKKLEQDQAYRFQQLMESSTTKFNLAKRKKHRSIVFDQRFQPVSRGTGIFQTSNFLDVSSLNQIVADDNNPSPLSVLESHQSSVSNSNYSPPQDQTQKIEKTFDISEAIKSQIPAQQPVGPQTPQMQRLNFPLIKNLMGIKLTENGQEVTDTQTKQSLYSSYSPHRVLLEPYQFKLNEQILEPIRLPSPGQFFRFQKKISNKAISKTQETNRKNLQALSTERLRQNDKNYDSKQTEEQNATITHFNYYTDHQTHNSVEQKPKQKGIFDKNYEEIDQIDQIIKNINQYSSYLNHSYISQTPSNLVSIKPQVKTNLYIFKK